MPRAEAFGVRVHRVGVKGVILPGEMKSLLNKVIEAEKADAAAMRKHGQHRQGDRGEPVLMRLKELESFPRDEPSDVRPVRRCTGGLGFSARSVRDFSGW